MPKQPKAPRRYSGYQHFYYNWFRQLKLKYPNVKVNMPEVSKTCAEIWKTADDAIKQKFQEEADQVNAANMLLPKPKRQPKKEKTPNATKKRVQDRAAKANENPSVDQSKVLKKEKFKRPVSAFVHFSSEFRSVAKGNHPELGFGQISRVLAEMWRDADEETKLKFKRLSLEQSERYRKEKLSK